ncbi:hypothetical protein P8452_57746 [Trifolium repens]|nr:hypothetical protein P8452_57746 [Trifolium repens]
MMERTFGQFVRVLVDMDLSKPLRDKVLVERKGFAFFVDLDYENLPPFCSHCKVIGHHVGTCKKLNYADDGKIDKDVRDKIKPIKEVSKIYVQTKDGRNEQNINKEVINVESDKIDDILPNLDADEVNSKASKVGLTVPTSSKENKTNSITSPPHTTSQHKFTNTVSSPPHTTNQHKITPPVPQQNKFSLLDSPSEDTPTTSNQQQPSANRSTSQIQKTAPVSHHSAPVLQPVLTPVSSIQMVTPVTSPADIFKIQDLQLEAEINEDSDSEESDSNPDKVLTDFSSNASFVATTQLEHSSQKLPDRLKRDMAFLKDSWANMAELDETNMDLNELVHSEDVVQVKFSKAQTKVKRKGIQSSKDSYATRSKVNPKPFK